MIKILFVIMLLHSNTSEVTSEVYQEMPNFTVCLDMIKKMEAQSLPNRIFTCRVERVLE